MKTVACFIDKYLQLSETFIYNEITHIERFRPIVITKEIINRDVFPFEPIFILRKRDIGRILQENDVGLIHAHFGWSGISIFPVALKTNIPLIVTFYGIDASRMLRYFSYRLDIKRLFRASQLVLVMSKDMKRDLIRAGCNKRKIKVHYTGVDIAGFKTRRHTAGDVVRILMCGRFVEKKGFGCGIRAYKGMEKKNTRLTIIGDGKQRPDIEALIESLGISPYVDFTGFLRPEKVREEMAKSDIFFAPHVTARNGDKEGMPTTVKEAMATGLPVISTYHAGIPELVEDGKSGFLVKEKDVDGLAYYLDKLVENPELREEMGRKGRKIVMERFNLEGMIEELEEIYGNNVKRV